MASCNYFILGFFIVFMSLNIEVTIAARHLSDRTPSPAPTSLVVALPNLAMTPLSSMPPISDSTLSKAASPFPTTTNQPFSLSPQPSFSLPTMESSPIMPPSPAVPTLSNLISPSLSNTQKFSPLSPLPSLKLPTVPSSSTMPPMSTSHTIPKVALPPSTLPSLLHSIPPTSLPITPSFSKTPPLLTAPKSPKAIILPPLTKQPSSLSSIPSVSIAIPKGSFPPPPPMKHSP